MDKQIRDDERAVSELIGEIMLIGIAIIAFGLIAVSVYSYIDKTPDTPHIEVAGRCDIDSDRVYLKHQGGESIGKEDLRILVDVGGNTLTFENLDGLWTLGSVIGLSTGNITQNDTVRVAIVHVPSGSVLSSGEIAEGTFSSASTNIAPTADAGDDQTNDLCNDTGILEVTFDGSGSYDPDGSITRYDWDFGDENTSGGTGASVTHAYTSPDTYIVTLTVTDSDGATASDTCIVTIDPAAPLCANAGPDRWVALGDAVELNGSKSTGCIRLWHWDIGDGNMSSSKAAVHTYGSTGIYNVTLTVEDYSGEGDADHAVIEVLNETVRVTNPQDGDVVSGTVSVDAYVFGISESGINRVEFFSDSDLIGTDTDGDTVGNSTVLYSIAWNTTYWTTCADADEGIRAISAIVYHSGQTGKSQDVVIEVDNDRLPVITIIAPEGGDYVNNTTAIRATVTDDLHTTNVTFLANGVFRGIMTPPNPFDRNWGYRVSVTVHAGGSDWNNTPVTYVINFTEELVSLGESGTIDTNSVRVINRYENGTFICEVPSQVGWNESGRVSAGGVTNGGFEEEDGWNYTESRTEWDSGYDNTTSYTGSRSFLIEYPWNQGSSAGDYAMVTQVINGSQITANSHILRVWVRDSYNGPTSEYHFKQVLVGETVLWEGDIAGDVGGWTPAVVNLSDYIGQDIDLTLRVYDKMGVGNFGVSVWWDDIAILTNTTGDVAWIVDGSLAAGTERHYAVYFDTLDCGAKGDPGYAWFNSTASEQPSATDGDAEIAYSYYTYQWNTSLELEGTTSVTVNATDNSCPVNQSNETTIVVYVDNVPDPAISITNPAIYENVTDTVNVTTAIYNILPEDARNVEFCILPEIVNGEWSSLGNDTTPAFTHIWDTTYWQAGYGDWEWTANSTGKYYLRMYLEDRYNQSAESDPNFYVWVKNPAPEINITAPASGSTVEGDVNVTAEVTDNGYVAAPAAYNVMNVAGTVVAGGSMSKSCGNVTHDAQSDFAMGTATNTTTASFYGSLALNATGRPKPSAATDEVNFTAENTTGAGVLACDGKHLYVKRWGGYPGSNTFRRIGTGYQNTIPGADYGLLGSSTWASYSATYYPDGYIYNGQISGGGYTLQRIKTETGAIDTIDVPAGMLERSTATVRSGAGLITSDGKYIYNLAYHVDNGGSIYNGFTIRIFDPMDGWNLVREFTSGTSSYYTDGVFCDGEYIYPIQWGGGGQITRISLHDGSWADQWSLPQQYLVDDPINGQYDWINNKVFLGDLTSGRIHRYSGRTYPDEGVFEPQSLDLGCRSEPGSLFWNATVSDGTAIKFRIAANNDNTTWNFLGPDGTSNSYYSSSGLGLSQFDGSRYLKYRAFLSTDYENKTPVLHNLSINYCCINYSTLWNTSSHPSGNYTICIYANDNANQTETNCTSVYLHNPAPVINITTPVNGSTVTGAVRIAADITDNGYVVPPVTYEITNESDGVVENGCLGYWNRRKPITITSSTLLLNYQINLTIDYEDRMQSDFDDLRFVAGDGSYLPYWTLNETDGVNTDIWVNVSSIPAGSSTIYVYYENAAATSRSEGDGTFDFFDDFSDLDKWTQYGTGSITAITHEERSVVKFDSCNIGRISSDTQVSGNMSIERMIKNYGGASDCDDWCGIIANRGRRVWRQSDKNINKFAGTTGDATTSQNHGVWNYYSGSGTSSTGTGTITQDWKLHSITRLGNTIESVYDGETMSITPPNVLAAGYVQILNDADAANRGVYVDWIRIRKHTTSEPACVIGSEENSNLHSALWNTSTLPGGNYTISVSAEDDAGQTNTSYVMVVDGTDLEAIPE